MFPNKLSPATIDGAQHFHMKHQLEKYQTPLFIPSNLTDERRKGFPNQFVRTLTMGITETSKKQCIDGNEGETVVSIDIYSHGHPKMMELPFKFRDPFTRSSVELSTLEHLTFLKNQDHAIGISNALSFPNRNQLNINSHISKEITSRKRIKTSPYNASSTALSEFQSNVDGSVLGINPLISRHIFSADTLCPLPQDGHLSHVWTLPAVQGKVPMISSTLNQDFKIMQKQTLQQASMITDANPWCRPIDSLHQSLYCAQHSTGNNNTRQGQHSILLYLSPQDDDHLSDYQCLVRKQIEYFEAGEDDVHTTAQGRNKPISLKQVGIRCRHCSQRLPQHRTRGSTYYPTKLRSIYQAAQNLARIHLCNNCPLIPEIVRREIIRLRTTGAVSEGKRYWAQSGKLQGIVESNDVLLLRN